MDHPNKDDLSMMTRINLIFRFSYTLPFLLASVCGIVYAIPYDVPCHILVLIPVAVLFLAVFSLARGKRSVECFGRRIDDTNVKNAAQFFTVFLSLIVAGTILLCLFEEHNPAFAEQPVSPTEAVFEVVSALATVGLTTGITPSLTIGSQIVLCVLMFLGRAGCMTVMLAWKTPNAPTAELPLERVRIG